MLFSFRQPTPFSCPSPFSSHTAEAVFQRFFKGTRVWGTCSTEEQVPHTRVPLKNLGDCWKQRDKLLETLKDRRTREKSGHWKVLANSLHVMTCTHKKKLKDMDEKYHKGQGHSQKQGCTVKYASMKVGSVLGFMSLWYYCPLSLGSIMP